MNTIRVCDSTIRKLSNGKDNSLSFKEKLEVAKLLDKLCVDVIELDEIRSGKADRGALCRVWCKHSGN